MEGGGSKPENIITSVKQVCLVSYNIILDPLRLSVVCGFSGSLEL